MRGPAGRLPAWSPVAACMLWLAATAWLRPLALPDEGRYGGVAWEMLRSGDWLTPTLNGLPYFHKPPLFYWITAGSMSLFGVHEWAARVAPWLGASLAAASLFLFARRWAGEGTARWALVVFATAPLSYFGAQYANLDMLVAGCITATIFAGADAILAGDSKQARRSAVLAWGFSALGVLAKGLIGAVLPGAVLLLWIAVARRWRSLPVLLSWRGAVLFLAVAAPWFVAMQERFPEFFHYFFIVQHFQRFAEGGFNNARPAWFYPAVLLLLMLPWSAWLAGLARTRPFRGTAAAPLASLAWCWVLLITLFFSVPQSKLIGYILPVVAPLALLLGSLANNAASAPGRGRRLARGTAGLAAAACVVGAIGFTAKADVRQREVAKVLRQQAHPGDEIVFLEDYYFAVPFYAQLRRPVRVSADWSPEAVASRDNWRKELADASRFDPTSGALVPTARLGDAVCAFRGTVWLVGDEGALQRHAWLRPAQVAVRARGLVVWRVDAGAGDPVRANRCGGKPSAS